MKNSKKGLLSLLGVLVAISAASPAMASSALEKTITSSNWCGKSQDGTRSYTLTMQSNGDASAVAIIDGSSHDVSGDWRKVDENHFDLTLGMFGITRTVSVEMVSKSKLVSTSQDGVITTYKPCS